MNILKKIKKQIKEKINSDTLFSLLVIKNNFWKINWVKTIWYNLKTQTFKDAIKCPIIISYNVKIKNIGTIIFDVKHIHPGMLSIGVIKITQWETNYKQTLFNNRGTLSIGGNVKLHPGCTLYINNNATMKAGNHVGFGADSKIICYKNISIGNDVRISWNSQIFDTDFHFLHNIITDKYYQRTKPIYIGNNVFIGNGCTIGKGTVIPSGCVVSCISKVSGNFSEEGENLLLVGNPAKVKKKGVEMSNGWRPTIEAEIAKIIES
ncbi:MAG: acyltransferase [Bacteroidaceae bacterium]|nr:acyltransferase [Bacteroidaceae bacterium]